MKYIVCYECSTYSVESNENYQEFLEYHKLSGFENVADCPNCGHPCDILDSLHICPECGEFGEALTENVMHCNECQINF